jgi:hypothetical protein
MTLFAVFPQLIIVRIGVAGSAGIECHTGKTLIILSVALLLLMAFNALHIPMLAEQREIRFGVVEKSGGLEFLYVMAFGAIVAQGFLVYIFMAGLAILPQPQECFAALPEGIIFYIIRFMAGAAVNCLVGAGQFISAEFVVEVFFVKAHHVEIAAVVFAMAFDTVFSFYFGGSVIAQLPVGAELDFTVAGQAFFVGCFVPDVVALRTIG